MCIENEVYAFGFKSKEQNIVSYQKFLIVSVILKGKESKLKSCRKFEHFKYFLNEKI